MAEAQEIESTAVRLLTTREHSRKELLGKLASRGFERTQSEAVVDELARRGLQSDLRFAEGYVEERVRKGSGPLRISAELRERGLDDGLIERSLEPYADEWRALLERVNEQKYGKQPPGDRRELARRARFLEYRGFPSELIAALLFD